MFICINYDNWICNGCINYLEFLLNHTENSFADKAIAEKELKNWYLNFRCKFNNYTKNMGINLVKLYLDNKFINNKTKYEIKQFLQSSGKIRI